MPARSCARARSSCACCGRGACRRRPPGAEPNDRATVLHVRDGAFDLLLTADAESNVLAGLPLPEVEALKVSHHGSDDPGLPGVLARLRPQAAVIEVGAHNCYGHPTPSTLAALRDASACRSCAAPTATARCGSPCAAAGWRSPRRTG